MNTLTTLYFPQTRLPAHHRLPLFLLFDQVHLIQPVEEASDQGLTGDHFTDSTFCQVHTPAPLGPDRDRFLRLVQEIHERKDNYSAQLSSLTLAGLSEQGKTQEGSSSEILTALLKPDTAARNHDLSKEALWQARLILKIGEILDQEEDELNLQLAELSEQKQRLFKELQGETDDHDSHDDEDELFAEILQRQEQIGRPSGSTLRNRFRAWQKIYNAGTLPVRPLVWTTRCQETAELICDRYETRTGHSTLPLLHLELPVRLPGLGAADLITAFRDQTSDLRQTLNRQLHELARATTIDTTEATGLLPKAEELQDQWQAALDNHFPIARSGRIPLTLHLLVNSPLESLLTENTRKPHAGHGLLAVIG